MPKFRKKPIVIEAIQFDGSPDTAHEIYKLSTRDISYIGDHLTIRTLEGPMTASVGDWIIKGVAGEVYPCKPDIFEATYEPVDDADRQYDAFRARILKMFEEKDKQLAILEEDKWNLKDEIRVKDARIAELEATVTELLVISAKERIAKLEEAQDV